MKKTSKLLILFAVLALLVSVICMPLSAATIKVEKGKANYTQSVTLGDSSVTVVDGTITVSNPNMIADLDVSDSISGTEVVSGKDLLKDGYAKFMLWDKDGVFNGKGIGLYFNMDISKRATLGDRCVITITYNTYNANSEKLNLEPITVSFDLEVKHSPTIVDYTALEEAIAKAEAIEERTVTAAFWARLQPVLADAVKATYYNDQYKVDVATANLNAVLADLEANTLDYSKLEALIKEARELDLTGLFLDAPLKNFSAALVKAEMVFVRAIDQDEINSTATTLEAAIKALREAAHETTTGPVQTETVIVPGETVVVPGETVVVPGETVVVPGETVTVEVPSDDCNKGIHKVWLILFIVFAVVSVILGTLLIVKEVKQKKKENPDVTGEEPNYDIEQDDNAEVAEDSEAAEEAEETEEAEEAEEATEEDAQ